MTDLQRVLIGSVARGKTKSGKPTVELFSTDKRLEFPALILFDFSMLEMVGIDPNSLSSDPVHRRFWAYYVESEKTTSRGNPYRDCQYLEPIENGNGNADPAPMNDAMLSTILAELQKQTKLLQSLVGAVGGNVEAHQPTTPEPGPQVPPPTVEPVDCMLDGECTVCGWKDPEWKDAEEEQEAEGSTLDEWFSGNTPTSPRELLQVLAEQDCEYNSPRTLHDALASQFGDTWRGWPPAGDLDAWSHLTKTALELMTVE